MKRLISVLAMAIILMTGGYVAIEHTERFYYAMTYLPGIGPVLTAGEHAFREVKRLRISKLETEEKIAKEIEEYIKLKKLDKR